MSFRDQSGYDLCLFPFYGSCEGFSTGFNVVALTSGKVTQLMPLKVQRSVFGPRIIHMCMPPEGPSEALFPLAVEDTAHLGDYRHHSLSVEAQNLILSAAACFALGKQTTGVLICTAPLQYH